MGTDSTKDEHTCTRGGAWLHRRLAEGLAYFATVARMGGMVERSMQVQVREEAQVLLPEVKGGHDGICGQDASDDWVNRSHWFLCWLGNARARGVRRINRR